MLGNRQNQITLTSFLSRSLVPRSNKSLRSERTAGAWERSCTLQVRHRPTSITRHNQVSQPLFHKWCPCSANRILRLHSFSVKRHHNSDTVTGLVAFCLNPHIRAKKLAGVEPKSHCIAVQAALSVLYLHKSRSKSDLYEKGAISISGRPSFDIYMQSFKSTCS